MKIIFYILRMTASVLLGALELLMLLRAVLSWFPIDEDSVFLRFLYAVTEPVVYPMRALLNRLGLSRICRWTSRFPELLRDIRSAAVPVTGGANDGNAEGGRNPHQPRPEAAETAEYAPAWTDFLTPRERILVHDAMVRQGYASSLFWYGGYRGAERRRRSFCRTGF